jgi:hypothetical protein
MLPTIARIPDAEALGRVTSTDDRAIPARQNACLPLGPSRERFLILCGNRPKPPDSFSVQGTSRPPRRCRSAITKGKIMLNALSVPDLRRNLSPMERGLSVLAGLGLAAASTKPRPNPLLNVLALLGGAYLAIRGASGRCPVKQAFASPPTLTPATITQKGRSRKVSRSPRAARK